jgi:hypothetical protein
MLPIGKLILIERQENPDLSRFSGKPLYIATFPPPSQCNLLLPLFVYYATTQ